MRPGNTLPHAGCGHGLALVLGSGGVRSIAAIGIAGRLAREGIRPDLVAGCSSGALFGAQIAMGMEGDEALRAATALWSPELTQQRRWRSYLQVIAPSLAGFGTGFAMRDDALIAQRVQAAFGDARLESLPTPLRVAATNAADGKPVVLTTGRVAHAVRASMALPIIFPSVEIDGRRLVDGVISDPLPLAAAADARVVITLGFAGAMPRRIDRLSRMVAQTSTTLINNLMDARIAVARASGQRLISIDLQLDQHVGLWDTSAMPYLFDAGWRACERELPEIVAALEGACVGPSPLSDAGAAQFALAI
jgi:NTE family protein